MNYEQELRQVLIFPIAVLLILVLVIAVAWIIWAVVQSWREKKRFARFTEGMIEAFHGFSDMRKDNALSVRVELTAIRAKRK